MMYQLIGKVIRTYIIKTKSFYVVTSQSIHLKGNMTYGATYHFDETIFLLQKREQ